MHSPWSTAAADERQTETETLSPGGGKVVTGSTVDKRPNNNSAATIKLHAIKARYYFVSAATKEEPSMLQSKGAEADVS
ncbi:hypothetical protein NHX12_003276 [Muraenolepis orangiensis]|uniref:Uncharacterized protein n=1 Tax=Muraenolepis orangiensis TaxID=630683 RepID=A0A9Q0IH25_9TELE|nr:hypothetical protein NHX12_003276 [Muraenolepis orangiensis]